MEWNKASDFKLLTADSCLVYIKSTTM